MGQTHLLKQLEAMEEKLASPSDYTGVTRWMLPYADFLTLLIGFFIILFGLVKMENVTLTKTNLQNQKTLVQVEKQAAMEHRQLDLLKESIVKSGQDPAQLLQKAISILPETAHPKLDSTMKDLEESLIRQLHLEGQRITVSHDSRGLIISFQDKIFFEPGKATLTPASEKTLDKLSTILIQTHRQIRVEGHTDNTPIKTALFPSNWELSADRATTIVRTLIEWHHFPPDMLSAAGYGEYHPLANNSTIEGKQKNRRVDIVVLNPL
jgi:chemotaxis protein MotB